MLPLPATNRRSHVQGPPPAGASDDFLGQETPIAPLCDGLLWNARRLHAQDLPDKPANRTIACGLPAQARLRAEELGADVLGNMRMRRHGLAYFLRESGACISCAKTSAHCRRWVSLGLEAPRSVGAPWHGALSVAPVEIENNLQSRVRRIKAA